MTEAVWALPLVGALQLAMARDNMRIFQAVPAGPTASGSVSVLVPRYTPEKYEAAVAYARGLARAYRWWAVLGWADTALLLWGLWAMVSKGPF